jgi:integrase/recombinase XerD
MVDPASVRFKGPLAPYFVGFWSELKRQGYSPLTGAALLGLAAYLSRWLQKRRLGPADLTGECIAKFTAHRRRHCRNYRTVRALRPLLAYLRCIRAAPTLVPSLADTPAERFLSEYAKYLAEERGLCASTIRRYTDFARGFVVAGPMDARLKWRRLRPADITGFVLRESQRWSVPSCKLTVCSLRSLLRYLHVTGRIQTDLASCVPAVAGWRLAWLPKALEPAQVQRVLRSCDARTTIGRRDAAIIQLLLRLGLRAGDAVGFTLDDLDWRTGEIVLRGKGRRESRLPLPRDVGEVLVAYLRRGRRPSRSRRLFLSTRAPFTPLTSGGLISAIREVLRKAGVTGGAHLLRHTAATQLLRQGASLPEVAHVLRHRHVDTTAIYAKVDFDALRTLAQPWPGGVA